MDGVAHITVNAENVGGEVVTSLKASYLKSVILVKDESDLMEFVRDGIAKLKKTLATSKTDPQIKKKIKPSRGGGLYKQAPIIKEAIRVLCDAEGTTAPEIFKLAVEEGKKSGVKIKYDNVYHAMRPQLRIGAIRVDKTKKPYRFYSVTQ
jgi:hypothetical protein